MKAAQAKRNHRNRNDQEGELQQRWEFSTICAFLQVFRDSLQLESFNPSLLEKALVAPPPSVAASKEEEEAEVSAISPATTNGGEGHREEAEEEEQGEEGQRKAGKRQLEEARKYLVDLHLLLLRPIYSGKLNLSEQTWQKVLETKIGRHWDEFEDFFDSNPLSDSSYWDLPLYTKIIILKALCDWQLDRNNALIEAIENEPETSPKWRSTEELGMDGQQNKYWYFGGKLLFREERCRLARTGPAVPIVPGKWEVVASTAEEIEFLALTLSEADDKEDRALAEMLLDDIIPPLVAQRTKEERAMNRRLRTQTTGGIDPRNVIQEGQRRSARLRNKVDYTYNDTEVDKLLKEYDREYKKDNSSSSSSPSTKRGLAPERAPTRQSKRLRSKQAGEEEEEEDKDYEAEREEGRGTNGAKQSRRHEEEEESSESAEEEEEEQEHVEESEEEVQESEEEEEERVAQLKQENEENGGDVKVKEEEEEEEEQAYAAQNGVNIKREKEEQKENEKQTKPQVKREPMDH
ncbi:hypothetical protein QOT17_005676 [Balamuthia mandrillaris]